MLDFEARIEILSRWMKRLRFARRARRQGAARWLVWAVLLSGLCSTSELIAHPISVTEALVRVSRETTDVQITVFLEDLYLFHDLVPNDRDFLTLESIGRGAVLHRKFLMERFLIRDAAGDELKPEFVSLEQPELPKNGVPLAELMSYKLSYRFRYKTPTEPEFLTVSQHLIDEEISIPAEMRLVVKQANSGITFKEALTSDESHTVRFQWDGKQLPAEPTESELQDWFEEQRKQTLGITDYSSIYSFLYIEDHEVRHEILMPLRTLAESVTLFRRDADFLDVDEQVSSRESIADYFVNGNPILLDGTAATPSVARLDFFGVDFKDLAKPPEQTRVSMASGRVGVILAYPIDAFPSTVDLTWNRFNELSYTVQMVVYSDESAERKTLSKVGGRNKYQWRSSGRRPATAVAIPRVELKPRAIWSFPLLSLALAALAVYMAARKPKQRATLFVIVLMALACWPLVTWRVYSPLQAKPAIASANARQVVESLLGNAYGAFRLRDESAAYDALAQGVDGELLRSLYLQLRRGLLMQQQGGTVARVREIDTTSGEPNVPSQPLGDERGFCYRLAWTIRGDVEHWGHIHSRTNQYEAIFTVEPRSGRWQLTNLDVLEEKRIRSETALRKLK